MWEILFEKIKAWDGVSDTGKDARLKIERNFEKLKTFIEGILSSTVALKADLVDGKVPENQLPPKADLVDGVVPDDQLPSPTRVLTSTMEGVFDWRDLFAKNCPWQIYDSYHALSRPVGLEVPLQAPYQQIEYSAQSYGSFFGTGSAIIKRMDTGELYSLTYEGGPVEIKKLVVLVDGMVPESQLPTSTKVLTSDLSYEFDWLTLFSKNCPWRIFDNLTASNRPQGLEVPVENELPIEYSAVSFGNDLTKGTAILKRISDGSLYTVSYDGVELILARHISTTELAEFVDGLNELNQNIVDINEELQSVSESITGINDALDVRMLSKPLPEYNTEELVDSLFGENSQGVYSIELGVGEWLTYPNNIFDLEVLRVDDFTWIHRMHIENRVYSRYRNPDVLGWTPWKLVGDDLSKYVQSDASVKHIIALTQAEYDALAVKDTQTIYFIKQA